MHPFDLNQVAFQVWDYCLFPSVLCFGAVHSSWNRRLYPYDCQSRLKRVERGELEWAIPTQSIVSGDKLWMSRLASINFMKVPFVETCWEQLLLCLQNLQEARIVVRYENGLVKWGAFVRLVCSLRKLTCNEELFCSVLRAHKEMGIHAPASVLREVVIIEKHERRILFSTASSSGVLSHITHFTVEGTHVVDFSDLLFLPQLQVFSSFLILGDFCITKSEFYLQTDFRPCKNLRLVRLNKFLVSSCRDGHYDKLRKKNAHIEFEIVE